MLRKAQASLRLPKAYDVALGDQHLVQRRPGHWRLHSHCRRCGHGCIRKLEADLASSDPLRKFL
jgi:hypothetical protein